MAMRSASAAPRPQFEVDDTVKIKLTVPWGSIPSLKDLESFCEALRDRGATDHQAIDVNVTQSPSMPNSLGIAAVTLCARLGWEAVLPE